MRWTGPLFALKISPLNVEIWTSSNAWLVTLANPNPYPKRHLDRFSRFFAWFTVVTDRQTDRQTMLFSLQQ